MAGITSARTARFVKDYGAYGIDLAFFSCTNAGDAMLASDRRYGARALRLIDKSGLPTDLAKGVTAYASEIAKIASKY